MSEDKEKVEPDLWTTEPAAEPTQSYEDTQGEMINSEENVLEAPETKSEKQVPAYEENEEEKAEIPLRTTRKSKPLAPKSTKKQQDEITLTGISKQLQKQTTQIDKMATLLRPVQKQVKALETQPKLIKELQSITKQIQKQISQIQKSVQNTKKIQIKKKRK
jgi:uncharacterized coiled-coil protein SlyX